MSRHGNIKTTVDGIVFDSRMESRRHLELQFLEKAGHISDLQRQVEFELIPSQKRSDGHTELPCKYIADFTYTKGDEWIVEDVKGMRTPEYVIKRKLMLQVRGITILETMNGKVKPFRKARRKKV